MQFLEYCPKALGDPACEACVELAPNDKRFAGDAWHRWPFNAISQGFLFTQQWWHHATTGVKGVEAHHEHIVSFVARQMLDVVSPANFLLTNPDVLETTFQHGGMNLVVGASNLREDQRRVVEGKKPVGAEAFQVGRDVAITPGKVVARNRLMELIQYAPCNGQGLSRAGLDRAGLDYEILHPRPLRRRTRWSNTWSTRAIRSSSSLGRTQLARIATSIWTTTAGSALWPHLMRFRRSCPGQPVHAVGYCIGGTLFAIAAAAMARDADARLASLTLLAAQTDFTEAGELMLFIDEAQVSFLEDMMAEHGHLDTRQMAGAFQILRSNDLIWSAMVQSYLKGERPPMFDLMAWNADATRMPYRMHSEYLRRLLLNNALATGHFEVDGRPVSLRDIRVPIFAVSTISDHVAPWRSVYKIQALTDADVTFVLSNGGHNAGIVNPPGRQNRKHQIATHVESENYIDPDTWQQSAVHHEGSWWPCWQDWLVRHSSTDRVPAPSLGAPSKGYAPLCEAPGTYVLGS